MNLLEQYIIALTNLHGIVSKEKVVEIYNSQNDDKIGLEHVDILYELSEELEKNFSIPGNGHFVHESILEFDEFDVFMAKKKGKPYYIPEKEELLKYTDDFYYEKGKYYDALFDYIHKRFKLKKNQAEGLIDDIHDMYVSDFGTSMRFIFDSFERQGIVLEDIEQAQEVVQLVVNFTNNTRIWDNNGFTPNELSKRNGVKRIRMLPPIGVNIQTSNVVDIKTRKKIGRNDPCPCGSGKKFKKCCLGKDE